MAESDGVLDVPNPKLAQAMSWSSFRVRRREDQLWLEIDVGNLVVDLGVPNEPRLRRAGSEPGFVAVRFPSQHIAEQIRGQGDPPVWPVETRRAGLSRLVFRLPDDVESIPLTDESLLSWGKLALQVSPAAVPRGETPTGAVSIAAPTDLQTGLEVPWRMVLSPPGGALWVNATTVVTHRGRAELWHTRLTSAGNDGRPDESAVPPTMRALWCTDDAFSSWLASQPPNGTTIPAPGLPFRMALTPRDRVQIVRATSDYTIPGYTPDPVDVDRVILSSLGATVSLRGAWSPPSAVLSILAWQHRATLGRDQAVQVVSPGYLLPFGQPAARVKVVERVVEAGPGGVRVAGLRVTDRLVVGRPTRTYPAFAQRFTGRALPFSRVTVSTTLTPPLDAPEESPLVTAPGIQAFIPRVSKVPLGFDHVATDGDGRAVTFELPAVFVDSVSAFAERDMARIRDAYNAPENDSVRRCGVAAQAFAYAPMGDPGDTDVETHSITFSLQEPLTASDDAFIAADQPRAHPAFSAVAVRMAAVAAVTRSTTSVVLARFDQRYLESGFGAANRGEVFLGLVTPVDLTLPSDRGALMDPGLRILALSRRLGPVGGDLDTLAGGLIDVPAMLAAAPSPPKIFGEISLSSIVQAIQMPAPGQPVAGAVLLRPASSPARALAITGPEADTARAERPQLPTRLSFEPKLQSDPLGILEFHPEAYAEITLSIDAGRTKNPPPDDFRLDVLILNGRPWRFGDSPPLKDVGPAVSASQPAFTLRLFGKATTVIEVDFSMLALTVQTGKETNVVPGIVGMRFDGVLRFVQRLKDAISGSDGVLAGGTKSPWGVIFAPGLEYIEAGISYSLPDIPLGVLTLKNIRFGLSLQIPYFFVPGNRRPLLLTFAFASRQDPFLIAVYVWGGGGYATISLRWGGIHFLEIGLEFGFYRQLGGGALSGAIELMAGIHFQVESDPATGGNSVELTAYVRARGQLEVLKIVAVSLELYIGLSYVAKPGMPGYLVGQARVTLTVSVLFFSASVSYVAEHRLSGGPAGDPTFKDQMPAQALWDEYATAFAVGG